MEVLSPAEMVERVARAIWWNAGSNDLSQLQKAITPENLANDSWIPTWDNVQNKDMWRRMAVAACLECGQSFPEEFVKYWGVRQSQ